MNTHSHGIIQCALKRGLLCSRLFVGMANSYDRADLLKLQKY